MLIGPTLLLYFLGIFYQSLLRWIVAFSFYVSSALGSAIEMLNKQVKHNIHISQVMFEYCCMFTVHTQQ